MREDAIELGDWKVERFGPQLEDAFLDLHGPTGCFCTAWWVLTWDAYCSMTVEEKLGLRKKLLRSGEHDGYLCMAGTENEREAVGWMQCGQRDRLIKLRVQFGLERDPGTWAITCFLVREGWRGKGVARALLKHALADLRAAGAARQVEAFPGSHTWPNQDAPIPVPAPVSGWKRAMHGPDRWRCSRGRGSRC